MMLTHHVPVSMQAVTGIIADGRQIVNRAHDEAVQYKKCALPPADHHPCSFTPRHCMVADPQLLYMRGGAASTGTAYLGRCLLTE